MKNLGNFLLGTATCTAFVMPTSVNGDIIDPVIVEAIKLIVSTIGGIITAILMNILRRKFPNIFGKKKK